MCTARWRCQLSSRDYLAHSSQDHPPQSEAWIRQETRCCVPARSPRRKRKRNLFLLDIGIFFFTLVILPFWYLDHDIGVFVISPPKPLRLATSCQITTRSECYCPFKNVLAFRYGIDANARRDSSRYGSLLMWKRGGVSEEIGCREGKEEQYLFQPPGRCKELWYDIQALYFSVSLFYSDLAYFQVRTFGLRQIWLASSSGLNMFVSNVKKKNSSPTSQALSCYCPILDKNTAATVLFELLNKYRPKFTQEKKVCFYAVAAAADKDTKVWQFLSLRIFFFFIQDIKKPSFVKYGLPSQSHCHPRRG